MENGLLEGLGYLTTRVGVVSLKMLKGILVQVGGLYKTNTINNELVLTCISERKRTTSSK